MTSARIASEVPLRQVLEGGRDGLSDLRAAAGALRDRVFGRKVFIRGVLEVSNFCRQNCHYCGMRRDNRSLERYRMELDSLREIVFSHRPECVTDINLQAGEDPIAVRQIVLPLIREIREKTDLGVSVCLGTLSPAVYRELREAGAFYYIIKLETGDAAHYAQVQAPGCLEDRLEAIRHLAASGWSVSSGFIVGLPGQTAEHITGSLELIRELPLAGCSVSPFIPGEETPLRGSPCGDLELTLNCLAWMRLAGPDRVIPAVSAMSYVGENGYARALQAGANLATINLTPSDLRQNYLIYKKNRLI
ncbi:MAG: radical SAM protein, partial [Verrucomicrobiae bacterium]|nr:radical SAM protein [Verrucomicrobiae bacterium]